jgi:GGDEF domain-containing protein
MVSARELGATLSFLALLADTYPGMTTTPVEGLARLASRRFQSFADAADSVLDMLGVLLPGKVLLAQVDEDELLYRVMDARGDAVPRLQPRATISFSELAGGGAHPVAGGPLLGRPDEDALESLAIRSYAAAPIEVSDGSSPIVLSALSHTAGAYDPTHAAVLTIAARLLANEWDSVRVRAELRRLSEAARDSEHTDRTTGLARRATFLSALRREWHLAKRGTVASYAVAVELADLREVGERYGQAMATLLVKDAAEVLAATARRTDHVGRLSDLQLGAVLVGCDGEDGVTAFIRRFEAALDAVARSRPERVATVCAFGALAGTPSPEEALDVIERGASDRAEQLTGDPAG